MAQALAWWNKLTHHDRAWWAWSLGRSTSISNERILEIYNNLEYK